jgi:hypothetical protein
MRLPWCPVPFCSGPCGCVKVRESDRPPHSPPNSVALTRGRGAFDGSQAHAICIAPRHGGVNRWSAWLMCREYLEIESEPAGVVFIRLKVCVVGKNRECARARACVRVCVRVCACVCVSGDPLMQLRCRAPALVPTGTARAHLQRRPRPRTASAVPASIGTPLRASPRGATTRWSQPLSRMCVDGARRWIRCLPPPVPPPPPPPRVRQRPLLTPLALFALGAGYSSAGGQPHV